MPKPSLCDYSDAYIHVKGTMPVVDAANNENKKVRSSNCIPFTDCISERNNTSVDYAEDIDVIIHVYN